MQSEHELVKRVFQAQKDDPKKGDWWQAVQSDIETYDINENELKLNSKNVAKKYIKDKIYEKAFEALKHAQSQHSKVKDIEYEQYACQGYMKNKQFSFEESSLLVALRSKTLSNIKSNIKSFSQNDNLCPLCFKSEDTQMHCLECPKLKSTIKTTEKNIEYKQIFSKCEMQQKAVPSLFLAILDKRTKLLQEGLPGTETLDPLLYM